MHESAERWITRNLRVCLIREADYTRGERLTRNRGRGELCCPFDSARMTKGPKQEAVTLSERTASVLGRSATVKSYVARPDTSSPGIPRRLHAPWHT